MAAKKKKLTKKHLEDLEIFRRSFDVDAYVQSRDALEEVLITSEGFQEMERNVLKDVPGCDWIDMDHDDPRTEEKEFDPEYVPDPDYPEDEAVHIPYMAQAMLNREPGGDRRGYIGVNFYFVWNERDKFGWIEAVELLVMTRCSDPDATILEQFFCEDIDKKLAQGIDESQCLLF